MERNSIWVFVAIAVGILSLIVVAVIIIAKCRRKQYSKPTPMSANNRTDDALRRKARERQETQERRQLTDKIAAYNRCAEQNARESTGSKALEKIGIAICIAAQYNTMPEDDKTRCALSDIVANMKQQIPHLYRFPEPESNEIELPVNDYPIERLRMQVKHLIIYSEIPYRSTCEAIREELEQLCMGDLSVCGKLVEILERSGYRFVHFDRLDESDERRIDFTRSVYGVSYPGLYYQGNDNKSMRLVCNGGVNHE